MGQSNHNAKIVNKNEHLLDKMAYILTQNSPVYGQLPVYRFTQKPYDYFLRYRQTYHNNKYNHQTIAQHTNLYQTLQNHRNVVKIEIVHAENGSLYSYTAMDLCSNSVVLDVYARYHNYTLQNAIRCKITNNKMFRDADLFYVMTSLIQVGYRVAQILDKNYLGLFRTDKIYMSTQGYIKIYPFRLVQPNLISHQNLDQTQNGLELQINHPANKHHVEHYRSNKSDIKDLAIVMTQLCLLCTREQQQKLSKELTIYKLEKGLSGRLSLGLRMLLLQLLERGQMGWQELKNKVEYIKREEQIRHVYSIKLQQNLSRRESQILMKQNQQIDIQKQHRMKMLQSVQLNLVPSRIELLSRRQQTS